MNSYSNAYFRFGETHWNFITIISKADELLGFIKEVLDVGIIAVIKIIML